MKLASFFSGLCVSARVLIFSEENHEYSLAGISQKNEESIRCHFFFCSFCNWKQPKINVFIFFRHNFSAPWTQLLARHLRASSGRKFLQFLL